MTTAEVFSDYLGLTPDNAPWAFGDTACELCGGVGGWWTVAGDGAEQETQCPTCYHGRIQGITATSPLAPEPTPGWLEVLAMNERFSRLIRHDATEYEGMAWLCGMGVRSENPHPTHAVARALIAGDPTLREACERASDYNKETPQCLTY